MPNSDEFQVVDGPTIAEMACAATRAERTRVHLNACHDDQVQRLINVMQPGTYGPPPSSSEQWEMLILLQGAALGVWRGRQDHQPFGNERVGPGRADLCRAMARILGD